MRGRRAALVLTVLIAVLGISARFGDVVPAHATAGPVPFFAHYYLWWDSNHWQTKLGSQYPYNSSPLAWPAALSSDGCTATALYSGDTLIDVPSAPLNLYSQDNASTLATHVSEAAGAGLSGFVVSWAGTGLTGQTPSSTAFNRRLDGLVAAAANYNASHSAKFYIVIGYEGKNDSGQPRSTTAVINDWSYIQSRYGSSPVFRVPFYGSRPIITWIDSGSYSVSSIAAITSHFGSAFLVIGDEHGLTKWNRGVAPYFGGDSWYWAAQDPYNNPQSFSQIGQLASTLHAQGKLWFSPLAAGFNRSNFGVGGVCVPRQMGQTAWKIYGGNKTSNPDGWMYISWNEFFENTYVEPSVRYGNSYLTLLKNIIATP